MNNRYNYDIDLYCKTIKDKEIKVINLTNYFPELHHSDLIFVSNFKSNFI